MKMIAQAMLKVIICIGIGAGMGWFVSHEWIKHSGQEDWKPVEVRKPTTKNEIKILDWTKKR